MDSTLASVTPSKSTLWIGRIMSTLPVLMLLFSSAMKFSGSPDLAKGFEHLGWKIQLAPSLGVLELICTVLYAVPRTSVLGALLLTAYLGGATATHVRVGDPFVSTIILGVVVWGGLFLRNPRLRTLLPITR
ncbi:MAG: DoxX family protein [Opitutaceae bacterium]|jgi:hypothetical protein